MVRALLATLAVCAFLSYIGWLHWESLIVAIVAFLIGWQSDMPEDRKRWHQQQERTRRDPPGMN